MIIGPILQIDFQSFEFDIGFTCWRKCGMLNFNCSTGPVAKGTRFDFPLLKSLHTFPHTRNNSESFI